MRFRPAAAYQRLGEPAGWRKPQRGFLNSTSDVSRAGVPGTFIHRICDTMEATVVVRPQDDEAGLWGRICRSDTQMYGGEV